MNAWISQIMYALTLRLRPKRRDAWLSRGFSRIQPHRLFRYWEKKIESDPLIRQTAIQLYNEFLGKTKQSATFAGRFKGFSGAVVDWVRDGGRLVADAVWQKRIEFCGACEHWESQKWGGAGRCVICGCSGAKQRLASAECPIGKWGRV